MIGGSSAIDSRRRATFAGVIASLFLLGIGEVGFAQLAEIVERGRKEYLGYCASCHGEGGKGDGPMAQHLLSKPADLTSISKRNNGEFPFWPMYRIVDGRAEVRLHGPRNMPVWGNRFRVEQGTEGPGAWIDLARGRIWQLVVYLESIQEK
jgi:mono/diheme cytochrome c family protein